MTRTRLPYFESFTDRHGGRHNYYRRGGVRTPLPADPTSPEFMQSYQDAAAGFLDPQHETLGRYAHGTFDALATIYYQSPDFTAHATETKRTYRHTIDRIRDEHGAARVAHLKRKHIKAIIAKTHAASGVSAANKTLKMIRLLVRFSIELEWRSDDPTIGLKQMRTEGDGFADWSEAEIARFESRWPPGSRQRLAMYLAVYTGQRRSDLVRMGKQHVRGKSIQVRQQKTGARLLLPIHPILQAELDATKREHLTFVVTEYGAPFSVAGFGNWFSEAAREAGLNGRSLHGLRKSAARRLAEAGCSAKQIAAVTGHASLREVERYTLAADQELLARDAVARLSK